MRELRSCGSVRGEGSNALVYSEVTLGPLFELPQCSVTDAKNQWEGHISSFSFGFPGSNSISHAELELADRESFIFR
jgi:hypothetical protein